MATSSKIAFISFASKKLIPPFRFELIPISFKLASIPSALELFLKITATSSYVVLDSFIILAMA